jgi:hypothetical protein
MVKNRDTFIFERIRELLEDLQDLAIIAERKDEPSEPSELVKEKLERKIGNSLSFRDLW